MNIITVHNTTHIVVVVDENLNNLTYKNISTCSYIIINLLLFVLDLVLYLRDIKSLHLL